MYQPFGRQHKWPPAVREHPRAWPTPHGGADVPEPTRPPSLREMVDAGVDFAQLPGFNAEDLDDLCDAIVVEMDDAQRQKCVERVRSTVQLLAEEGYSYGTGWWLWEEELYADPGLAERFVEALPYEWRRRVESFREEYRHPHKLLVVPVGTDSHCSACWSKLVGEAVQVADVSEAPLFCGPCLSMAAAALSGRA